MAYDTVRLRSPYLGMEIVDQIKAQCLLRSGVDLASGEIRYELYTGELLGSWDSRIAVLPMSKEWALDKSGRNVEVPCEPYIVIEASVHKIALGHNVYGGPTNFLQACRDFVQLVETLLSTELPPADWWSVLRVDRAEVFRLSRAACQEFFDGIQLISFPRRKRGASKYAMAVHFKGKTTTVKLYHKGSEFRVHDRARLRRFFEQVYRHLYGRDHPENRARAERKTEALQRLADRRLRVEVGINRHKLRYDFGKDPRVDEVSDAYLESVFDAELEKLLREGKQAMTTLRQSKAVLHRLKAVYGDTLGMRLYGFWSTLAQHGEDSARDNYSRATFFRCRKQLEDAGVSWRGSDVRVVANDGALPHDFSPVRTDPRLCQLPARNREEFQVSRETLRLAA
ncbi:phage/plasmid replication protein, II/X family [Cupriavidus neocaledonicus]|uniref:Phage replication cri-related protein n=1 Tax=Cupriavidus neocaledonicus TaxID=1040979 RepID=A0ABY1UYV1_9BURK|nr:phage/plasmid replication protein, II/X family [Cupriavidus neocaledonicus]SOZ35600.1 putative phage replication cri-related protein [Cupriavidus neocaledonicus]